MRLPIPTKPGLFITATDTEVGKTLVTCAIAHALRQQLTNTEPNTVGVLKPLASGCRHERLDLISEDAEALAHYADCRLPLATIAPIRYAPPLAPAQAAEETGQAPNYNDLARAITEIDQRCDHLLVEGLGGILAPIDDRRTVLDLAAAFAYPTVVVTRPSLGTLNHTALTIRTLRRANVPVAGIVINRFDPDSADPAAAPNRTWLVKMNNVPILATIPDCPPKDVQPHRAKIPAAILDAVAITYWPDVLAAPSSG